ncbi:unnamed protein product [Aphanomyces euteiches]
MAQAHRKIKQYDTAILYYQEALALCPTKASTHFALAFTYHMQGNLKDAIQSYHTALSFDPEDPVASQMLDTALQEMFSSVHLSEEEETKQEDEEDDVLDVSLNMDISVESVDL